MSLRGQNFPLLRGKCPTHWCRASAGPAQISPSHGMGKSECPRQLSDNPALDTFGFLSTLLHPGSRGSPALRLLLGFDQWRRREEIWGREDSKHSYSPTFSLQVVRGWLPLLWKTTAPVTWPLQVWLTAPPLAPPGLSPLAVISPSMLHALASSLHSVCLHLLNSSHDPIWICPLFAVKTWLIQIHHVTFKKHFHKQIFILFLC